MNSLCNKHFPSTLDDLKFSDRQNLYFFFMFTDFEVADSACCHIAGAGLHGGLIPCGILSQVCPDRSKYVFWDPFHLTETSYEIIAKHMMDGDLNYISPMNIRQLLNY